MKKILVAALAAILVAGPAGAVGGLSSQPAAPSVERVKEFVVAQRRSCQAANSCEDAVEMWCGGYSGADRDRDGIPCENVCRSKSQVDAIKSKIGC